LFFVAFTIKSMS